MVPPLPTRLSPLVLFICLAPIAVLAFVAVWSLSLERNALEARRELLARQRIETAATLIQTHIQALGTDVLAQTQAAYATDGAAALSSLARKRVFSYALIVQKGVSVQSATALEHQYDAVRVLQDEAETLAATLSVTKPVVATLLPVGGAFTLLRCSRNADYYDICVALNGHDVAHALRTALDLVVQGTGLVRVGLVAPNGATIAADDAGDMSGVWHPLDGLLVGWQLHGEDDPAGITNLQSSLVLYLVAGALSLGWAAMMWMLHRSALLKEEAAAARANVIAQLAHELRTPLANLRLYTDLLSRNATDAEAVQRYGKVLDGEIDRLSHLAENAIVVARGAMAAPKLEMAVPDECLGIILERFAPMLEDARCSVSLTPGAADAIRFDKTSWERSIINLIDNARKYAPGSAIAISTTLGSDMLRLDVCDHGPGIAIAQREQIFEPLERGIGAPASGFGLGLAAVRALARQNGGDCRVEAMAPGARFILTMQTFPVGVAMQEQV